MTQHKSVNIKGSNLQLIKLKSIIKIGPEVTLNLSLNVIGVSNDETNFHYRLILTDWQVSMLGKPFANNSSAKMNLLKTQLSKIIQLGEFSGSLLAPLLTTDLPLAKNVLKTLAKSVLVSLRLRAAVSAAIQKKESFELGITTLTMEQWNKWMI